jgi:hypothetical protein
MSTLSAMSSHSGLLHGGSPLTAVVLFSSVASLVGAAGQASYVAANASMDEWSGQRASMGERIGDITSILHKTLHVMGHLE